MGSVLIKGKMKKTDGRKLSHEALEGIRIQAVKAVIYRKKSPEEVIDILGFSRTVIYGWLKKYKERGWKALGARKAKGPDYKITKEEEKKLQRWLMKDPRQLHFYFGLWTQLMIQELIWKKFGKKVDVSTVSKLLQRIGYTYQRPLMRAYEQNAEAVKRWKEEEYPAIKKEAQKEKRKIFFGDQSGFRSTGYKGKTWAPKGSRPTVRCTGQRFGINSISAISPQGHLRFSLYEGSFNGGVFIEFLDKLLDSVPGNITLVVDGHPVHKQKQVQKFIEATDGRLKIYILPGYSPNLNPDEQVWQNTKPVVHKRFLRSKKQLIAKIRSHLHKLQKSPDLIKSFFAHPDVAYVMQV
jgi:transposase